MTGDEPVSDADLLREAGEPTTSPERLRALTLGLLAPHAEQPTEDPARDELLAVVARNPALPLSLLRALLLEEPTRPHTIEAWHNPTVPLLLMQEPSLAYDLAASRAIRFLMLDGEAPPAKWADPGPLAHRVAALARKAWIFERWRPQDPFESFSPHARAARALARHLAGLFSLPWPGP